MSTILRKTWKLLRDYLKNRHNSTQSVSLILFIFDPYFIVFQQFSSDGNKISAIEFFKLCKLCKVYPVVITFEDLKKIVLKNKDFWGN